MKSWKLVLLTVLAVLFCGTASAQDRLDPVRQIPFGEADAVAALGQYVVYGIDFGLMVVDPTDAASPTTVSRLPLSGEVRGITVAGDLAFVAVGFAGISVVDLSQPGDPVELDTLSTQGQANEVAVSGGVVFVADGSAGLTAIDPTGQPGPSSIDFPDRAIDVAISGIHALVAARDAGLRIVDVSQPDAMVEVASVPMRANAVVVDGHHAFVAAGGEGLLIFDITQPSLPVQVGSIGTQDWARDVALSAGHAWLADWGHLRVIDVSTPSAPNELASIEVSQQPARVDVFGGRAFLTTDSRGYGGLLPIIDVSTPANPRHIGSVISYPCGDALVSGNLVMVVLGVPYWIHGLTMLDFSDPTSPAEIGTFLFPAAATAAVVKRGRLYTVDQEKWLRIYDISSQLRPVQLGELPLPATAEDMAVSGSLVVVVGQGGIQLIDVGDPSHPAEIGHVADLDHLMENVTIVGDRIYAGYAYCAFEGCGGAIQIFDISEPSAPAMVAERLVGFPDEILTRGRRGLFLVSGSSLGMCSVYLDVYDIHDPDDPVLVNGSLLGYPYMSGCSDMDLTVLGSRAITLTSSLLNIVDLRAPSNVPPIPLDDSWYTGVATCRSHVLLAGERGLGILTPNWRNRFQRPSYLQ
jgi:hypothetical protein